MTTLAVTFAGSIIAGYPGLLKLNENVATDPGEQFLMSLNTAFRLVWITVFFVAGPLFCAFQTTMQLLSQMKLIAQSTPTADR